MILFSRITVTKEQFEEINAHAHATDSFKKLKELTDAQYSEYGASDLLKAWLNEENTGNHPIHINKSEDELSLCFVKGNNILILTVDQEASYNYAVYDNATVSMKAVLSEPEKYWKLANQQ